MQEPLLAQDWIVAPATPPGEGAVAVARLDGPGCWEALRPIWRPRVPLPHPPPPRRLHLGQLLESPENPEPIDEMLLVFFSGPASYTGNDLVELHCHGSPAVMDALLETLRRQGARMAQPGEFTRRAFLNGRMDLAQAEGVANLIAAQTRQAGRLALAQLEGRLSRELRELREMLLDFAAETEARLDFPEEEIEPENRRKMARTLEDCQKKMDDLLAGYQKGRLYRDGARVVLLGPPNAGKSSLFNALVGREKAIVTPHPGTTRDSLEATLDLAGIPLTLVDTAGLREQSDCEIEQMGMERSRKEAEQADLLLLVLDGTKAPEPEETLLARESPVPCLTVINKSDEPLYPKRMEALEIGGDVLRLSALEHKGLDRLEKGIQKQLGAGRDSGESLLLTNQRHREALEQCRQAVRGAQSLFAQGESGDLIMVDVYEALGRLEEMLGQKVDGTLLDRIFSRFCIGK